MIDTTKIKERWGGLSVEVFASLTNKPTKTDVYEALIDLKEVINSHDKLKEELSKYADYIDGEWRPNTMEGDHGF